MIRCLTKTAMQSNCSDFHISEMQSSVNWPKKIEMTHNSSYLTEHKERQAGLK